MGNWGWEIHLSSVIEVNERAKIIQVTGLQSHCSYPLFQCLSWEGHGRITPKWKLRWSWFQRPKQTCCLCPPWPLPASRGVIVLPHSAEQKIANSPVIFLNIFIQFFLLPAPAAGNHRSDLFFYEFVCLFFWSIVDLPHHRNGKIKKTVKEGPQTPASKSMLFWESSLMSSRNW